MLNIFYKIVDRFYLPNLNFTAELKKNGLLRIVLGLVVFFRVIQIVNHNYIISHTVDVISLITLLSTLLFTIGFLTPLSTISLFVFIGEFDSLHKTPHLGSAILLLTLLIFLFTNSGLYYSVDNYFLRKRNTLFLSLYNLLGDPQEKDIKRVYFFIFFIYGVISFGALLFHIQDYYWFHGLTIKSLLSNSFLNKYFIFFRTFEESFPYLISVLSILGGVFQSLFQFLMIPLVFTRAGCFFVKWWGMKFFVISLFFINLSYLPHIEIVLWGAIFFRYNQKTKSETITLTPYNQSMFKIFLVLYSFILLTFIFVKFPYFKDVYQERFSKNLFLKTIKRIHLRIGLNMPHVFNSTDLKMGNRWMIIKKDNKILPITNLDGSRNNYQDFDYLFFTNHNSDLMYFANTLDYRRTIINVSENNLEKFHKQELGYDSLFKRILFDYKYHNYKGEQKYQVIVYQNNSSVVKNFVDDSQRHKQEEIYNTFVTFDGHKLNFVDNE